MKSQAGEPGPQASEPESHAGELDSQVRQNEFWRAMADPTRRRILELLKEDARTTGDLCRQFELSRFAVMKHLGVLEQARLINVRRVGRERWNHLHAELLSEILGPWWHSRDRQRAERVPAAQRWRPQQPSTFSIEED